MSTKEKLDKLAEKLKKAKTQAERDRLMTQIDGILGLESSPGNQDQELNESWERSRD